MGCYEQMLSVIIYVLAIILIIVMIMLLIRTFYVLNKIGRLVDNMNEKVNHLDGFFGMVDSAKDTFTFLSDKVVSGIVHTVGKLFGKKEGEDDE